MNRVCCRLAWPWLLVLGCTSNLQLDPDGYRCDPGNLCPDGYVCQSGVCHPKKPTTAMPNSPCQSVDDCQALPATTCIDEKTLRSFPSKGTCESTGCEFAPIDTLCDGTCVVDHCQSANACLSANDPCMSPPNPSCADATTRVTFDEVGMCEVTTGLCRYPSMEAQCPFGCVQGQCLSPSLRFEQTGPRVRFAINSIDVAPGSSGSRVVAVGERGKLAQWDGLRWTEINSSTTESLQSVSFVSGSTAWVVGTQSTALMIRPTSSLVSTGTLPGPQNVKLVAVSGRSESEILIAGQGGELWRMKNGSWVATSLPSDDGPYRIAGAFLDETMRERLTGECGTNLMQSCVGYRFLDGFSPAFQVNKTDGAARYVAVGGGFDAPSLLVSGALVGGVNGTLVLHSNDGVFSSFSAPALSGGRVVAITSADTATGRDVYVLTSSEATSGQPGRGHLYRLQRVNNTVTAIDALTTTFGEEVLSPHESNGVLVAAVRRSADINSIFRSGPTVDEALDVADDFIGASLDDGGNLVLATGAGAVVSRRPTSTTFTFERPQSNWSAQGFDARFGTGTLLVGTTASGSGLIARHRLMMGFSVLAEVPNTIFQAVCRVSDTEAWAVGNGGIIYRITGQHAQPVVSPTTADLRALDCSAGRAVAVGAHGTVIRWSGAQWESAPVAFPLDVDLRLAKFAGPDEWVAGPEALYRWNSRLENWVQIATPARLTALVVRGPQEVYGAFERGNSSEISRFDGATWGDTLVQVSGVLQGGVQRGNRVVWGGTVGALVETP